MTMKWVKWRDIDYVLGGMWQLLQYLLITRQGACLSLNIPLVGGPQGSMTRRRVVWFGAGPGTRRTSGVCKFGGLMFQVRGLFWMEVFPERCGLALRASALWMRWFPRALSSPDVMTASVLQGWGVVSLKGFLALTVEHLSSLFSSHSIFGSHRLPVLAGIGRGHFRETFFPVLSILLSRIYKQGEFKCEGVRVGAGAGGLVGRRSPSGSYSTE